MTKVLVNGTFDVVHYGHIKLLEYARSFENSFVYVLIDSDQRTKKLKGSCRPVNNQHHRKFFLESIKFVDKVDIFDSDTELIESIRNFSPDIMVKGSDYKNKEIIGEEFCGKVLFYDRTEHSSTSIIQHSINR
jgi:D-beta-D-heptose 7-phosphate kinase/D-beta-D-heptose 1-phosphate adenosyltransferase